jgi:hypothetical protein
MADKPAFDPSKPFQAAEKPAFDPNAPFKTPEQTADSERSLGGALAEGVEHLPESAINFAKDIAQPILHPYDTAKSMKNLGLGILEKIQDAYPGTGTPLTRGHEQYAEQFGQMLADRYGGWEEVKKTLATDPVGFMADASMLLTGGATATERLPAIGGKVARVAKEVDPLTQVGRGLRLGGEAGAHLFGDIATGTSAEAIRSAGRAGFEGGAKDEEFTKNLRGQGSITDITEGAQRAVGYLKQRKNAQYKSDMVSTGLDKTILSWNDVETAQIEMNKVANFKGVSISPSTADVRNHIDAAISFWKNKKASEFWTPSGFDALKQYVGDILDQTKPGTREHMVANTMYNAIRNTVIKQVPDYARAMKGYEEASQIIRELEKTLSLGETSTVDTQLRKLQSVMRNNVNTNWGRRAELVEFLKNAGAPHILEQLAGQALGTWVPRGLARYFAGAEGASLLKKPHMLPLVLLSSPRVMGEGVRAGGKIAKTLKPARPYLPLAYQAGRAADNQENQPVQQPFNLGTIHPQQQTPAEVLDNPSGIPVQ